MGKIEKNDQKRNREGVLGFFRCFVRYLAEPAHRLAGDCQPLLGRGAIVIDVVDIVRSDLLIYVRTARREEYEKTPPTAVFEFLSFVFSACPEPVLTVKSHILIISRKEN